MCIRTAIAIALLGVASSGNAAVVSFVQQDDGLDYHYSINDSALTITFQPTVYDLTYVIGLNAYSTVTRNIPNTLPIQTASVTSGFTVTGVSVSSFSTNLDTTTLQLPQTGTIATIGPLHNLFDTAPSVIELYGQYSAIGPTQSVSGTFTAQFELVVTDWFDSIDVGGYPVQTRLRNKPIFGYRPVDNTHLLLFDGVVDGLVTRVQLPATINFDASRAVTTVPIPAAVWFFGSALGLMGLARRKLVS